MTHHAIQQIVTFKIQQELFGLPVMDVREILFPHDIQPITSDVAYVIGVIVLRGQVISVIDFRKLMNKEPIERNKKQRIIILSHNEQMIGLLVDEVSHVSSAAGMEFDQPPKNVSPYIFAICKHIESNVIVYMIETKRLHEKIGGEPFEN